MEMMGAFSGLVGPEAIDVARKLADDRKFRKAIAAHVKRNVSLNTKLVDEEAVAVLLKVPEFWVYLSSQGSEVTSLLRSKFDKVYVDNSAVDESLLANAMWVAINETIFRLGSYSDRTQAVHASQNGEALLALVNIGLDSQELIQDILERLAEASDSLRESDTQTRNVPDSVQTGILESYRSAYSSYVSKGLNPYAPVEVVFADGPGDAMEVATSLRAGTLTSFVGPSGFGKSHAAIHATIAMCRNGSTPIYVEDRGRYATNEIDRILDEAVMPFVAESSTNIMRYSHERGGSVVVVLDGFRGTDESQALLNRLVSLQRRFEFAILVTSEQELKAPVEVRRGVFQPLDSNAFENMLESYAIKDIQNVGVRTPFEIAMYASVLLDLDGQDISPSDVHDVYLAKFVETEQERAVLRCLASHYVENIVWSVSTATARSILLKAGFQPSHIDALSTSRLLSNLGHRIGFEHDLHLRYLAAEELVLTLDDGSEIAELLLEPRRSELIESVLSIESDPEKLRSNLRTLASGDVWADSFKGKFGSLCREQALVCFGEMLTSVVSKLNSLQWRFLPTSGVVGGSWVADKDLSAFEKSLMSEAILFLSSGEHNVDFIRMLDLSNQLCAEAVSDLEKSGDRLAISKVVASISPMFGGSGLPVSFIKGHVWYHSINEDMVRQLIDQIVAELHPRSWVRANLALSLASSTSELDFLPELVRDSYQFGGYHLRLHAFGTIRITGRRASQDVRDRLVEVLEEIQVPQGDWGLGSSHLEALDAVGGMEPIHSACEIESEISELLAHSEEEDMQLRALGVCGQMFEAPLVGPYGRVIENLKTEERFLLYLMASEAATKRDSFGAFLPFAELIAN